MANCLFFGYRPRLFDGTVDDADRLDEMSWLFTITPNDDMRHYEDVILLDWGGMQPVPSDMIKQGTSKYYFELDGTHYASFYDREWVRLLTEKTGVQRISSYGLILKFFVDDYRGENRIEGESIVVADYLGYCNYGEENQPRSIKETFLDELVLVSRVTRDGVSLGTEMVTMADLPKRIAEADLQMSDLVWLHRKQEKRAIATAAEGEYMAGGETVAGVRSKGGINGVTAFKIGLAAFLVLNLVVFFVMNGLFSRLGETRTGMYITAQDIDNLSANNKKLFSALAKVRDIVRRQPNIYRMENLTFYRPDEAIYKVGITFVPAMVEGEFLTQERDIRAFAQVFNGKYEEFNNLSVPGEGQTSKRWNVEFNIQVERNRGRF